MNEIRSYFPRRARCGLGLSLGLQGGCAMPKCRIAMCLLALLSAVWLARPARADCISECLAEKWCAAGTRGCDALHHDCFQRCSTEPTGPGNAGFGAIAYGPKHHAAGWAYGQPDAQTAAWAALTYCMEHGDDCQVVASFFDSCEALATAPDGGFAARSGRTRAKAHADAMTACTRIGLGCKILTNVCSRLPGRAS